MIHLALVDDHTVTRKGIRSIIELHPGIKVILEASNGKELLEKLATGKQPDIIILDINMPQMNGYQAIEELQLHYPKVKVIAFSFIDEEDAVMNMIYAGACGYISKNADPSTLADAVITAHKKGFYLSELVKKEYFRKYTSDKKRPGFHGKEYLSPKELQFLKLAATNLNYKEIAVIMEVRPKTVENYRDNLFMKLDIKNRAALTLYGLKNGLIDIFDL
ncbi:MAG: response regulator [Sediminibacterium sp.]|nr:response regulator [Sediminibacterium sp.]